MNSRRNFLSALVVATMLVACAVPVVAQDYKEAYNAGIEAANDQSTYAVARAKFAEAAQGADEASDAELARKARSYAAQLDYRLGTAAFRSEEFEAALTHYTNGSDIYPSYVRNQYGRGLALKKLGRMEEALEAWKVVAADTRDRKTALTALGAIRDHFYFQASSAVSRRGAVAADADRALTALGELTKYIEEPDANYHYYSAVAYQIKGDFSDALGAADQALELHTGSRTDKAKIWFVKGEVLVALGDKDAAKVAFQNAAYGSYKPSAEHYLETL